MKPTDEKDALWNLLGHASHQEASPYFSRKVLHSIREEKPSSFASFLRALRWLIPASTCAAIALGWFAYQQQQESQLDAYFDTAADLQSLVAQEDTSSWEVVGN